MQTVTRQAEVQLGQDTTVDATLGVQGVTEAVKVTATATLIDKDSATIKSGVSSTQISALPVGQEYRDLLKLIPGVQYSQDSVRGPSAGGSGQDNVYQFDGVNVTLPLFGTLSAEPSSHDIAQVDDRPRRRARGRLRPLRRLLDRLGQQVRHQPVLGRGQLPVPERQHDRGARRRQRRRATSRTAPGSRPASADR